MPRYEYKVVPAPTKGLKAKGVKGAEARFSNAIQTLMNDLAGDGWEYQRAETLPSVERSGLTSSTTEWRNVLVFRRPRQDDADAFAPELLPAPAAVVPAATLPDEPTLTTASDMTGTVPDDAGEAEQAEPTPVDPWSAPQSETDPDDNGVEETHDVSEVNSPLETLSDRRNS